VWWRPTHTWSVVGVSTIKLLQTAAGCRFQKFSKSVNIWPSFGKEGLLSDSPMHWCDVLLKAGTHYPCSRVVLTDREHDPWTRVSFWTPVLQVENNYDVTNSSTCRSRWPVFTGVQKWRPCSRAVTTAREHGSWTRIVCTEHKRWRTHSPATWYLWHTATAVTAASDYAIHSERLLSSWRS